MALKYLLLQVATKYKPFSKSCVFSHRQYDSSTKLGMFLFMQFMIAMNSHLSSFDLPTFPGCILLSVIFHLSNWGHVTEKHMTSWERVSCLCFPSIVFHGAMQGPGKSQECGPNLILVDSTQGEFYPSLLHHYCQTMPLTQFPSQGGLGWRSVLTFTLSR